MAPNRKVGLRGQEEAPRMKPRGVLNQIPNQGAVVIALMESSSHSITLLAIVQTSPGRPCGPASIQVHVLLLLPSASAMRSQSLFHRHMARAPACVFNSFGISFRRQYKSKAKRMTSLSRILSLTATHRADNVACGNVVGHFGLPVEIAKHVEVFTAVKRDSAGCPSSNRSGFEKNRIQLFCPR